MITNFKKYEEYKFTYKDDKENVLNTITNYIENIIPINKKEGFYQCLYEDGNNYGDEYGERMDFSDILIHFYFLTETSEDIFEKLEEFAENEGFEYYRENYTVSIIEISYLVPEEKIKEYYQSATEISNYNL